MGRPVDKGSVEEFVDVRDIVPARSPSARSGSTRSPLSCWSENYHFKRSFARLWAICIPGSRSGFNQQPFLLFRKPRSRTWYVCSLRWTTSQFTATVLPFNHVTFTFGVANHFRPEPVSRTWKMKPYSGQTVTNLVHKCQLVLSLIMGGEATKISDPSEMCSTILNLCKQYCRDHYFMRQRLGFWIKLNLNQLLIVYIKSSDLLVVTY